MFLTRQASANFWFSRMYRSVSDVGAGPKEDPLGLSGNQLPSKISPIVPSRAGVLSTSTFKYQYPCEDQKLDVMITRVPSAALMSMPSPAAAFAIVLPLP